METIYFNGSVVTMDKAVPQATAFVVACGRIKAVGKDKDMLGLRSPLTETVDLLGRTVVPGFIETHAHPSYAAVQLAHVDCSATTNRSIEELVQKLRAKADASPANKWIIGNGYDDTGIADKRHLCRQDLDKVSLKHPVLVQHMSGHMIYVNSAALKLAGIDANTPDPEGGSLGRGTDGIPNGLLLEPAAMNLVTANFPAPTAEEFTQAIPDIVKIYLSQGVTSAHDAAIGYTNEGPQIVEAYVNLHNRGQLGMRVYLTCMESFYSRLHDLGIRGGFGSDRLRFGGVKMFQDGSIQIGTAALSRDYFNREGYKGHLINPQEQLDAQVSKYHRLGYQVVVHANGDFAIESVLSAMEKCQAEYPRQDHRHMIIHCQMATDDQLARISKMGIILSFFVNHVHIYGDRHANQFIGPERASRIDPLGASLRAGVRFTLHSDNPVCRVSPLDSMHNAVNRLTSSGRLLGPEQRISAYDALKAYTSDAAYCSFEENIKGTITPGKLADFVVLAQNPLEVEKEKIKEIQILSTIMGGEVVFSQGI